MAVDAREWSRSLYAALERDRSTASELRKAAVAGELGNWTQALTGLVARSFRDLGLDVAAKGHKCASLPVGRGEYLALDVTALPNTGRTWRFPAAVCELENSAREDIVAYSLWKVLCIRDVLRVVFCYQNERADASGLVRLLGDNVVGTMSLPERERLSGDTLVFVGSHSESNSFPYGFFRAWRLNRNVGRFEAFGWRD